jgi:hypothetical protein
LNLFFYLPFYLEWWRRHAPPVTFLCGCSLIHLPTIRLPLDVVRRYRTGANRERTLTLFGVGVACGADGNAVQAWTALDNFISKLKDANSVYASCATRVKVLEERISNSSGKGGGGGGKKGGKKKGGKKAKGGNDGDEDDSDIGRVKKQYASSLLAVQKNNTMNLAALRHLDCTAGDSSHAVLRPPSSPVSASSPDTSLAWLKVGRESESVHVQHRQPAPRSLHQAVCQTRDTGHA